MPGFENLLKNAGTARSLTQPFGVNNQLLAVAKAHQKWMDKFSTLHMLEKVAKGTTAQYESRKYVIGMANLARSLRAQHIWGKNFSALFLQNNIMKGEIYQRIHMKWISDIAKNGAIHSRPVIPGSAINAIAGASKQFQNLSSQYSSTSAALQKSIAFNPLGGLHSALMGVTGQLVSYAALRGKWDLFEDFEQVSQDAVAISENISGKERVTSADIKEIRLFLGRIEAKIHQKDAGLTPKLMIWITIIGFILAVIAEARNWLLKPETVSKQEMAQFKKEVFLKLEAQLKSSNDTTLTNRVCYVYRKPTLRAGTFARLPEQCGVVVLSLTHKWAYVSYINPKNHLAETGWILKKYLNESK